MTTKLTPKQLAELKEKMKVIRRGTSESSAVVGAKKIKKGQGVGPERPTEDAVEYKLSREREG